MSFLDMFRAKKKDNLDFDPLKDLELAKLKVGYLLDYDLKTWKVTAYNRYDCGDGYLSDEWELTSGRTVLYLEREEDDEVEWRISKKLPLGAIEGNISQYIIDNEDPPSQIVVKEQTYYLDTSGTAHLYKNGGGEGIGFISWEFIDENDESFVTIEQWDEKEFEAAIGKYVEEYQFVNILPGKA